MATTTQNLPRPIRIFLCVAAVVVVLPAWAHGLATGKLILALGGLPLAVLMIYYSIPKKACPSCGKAIRSAGRLSPKHCIYCGASYAQTTVSDGH